MSDLRLDLERERRTGVPEVVFGMGKTCDEILAASERLLVASGRLLVTRLAPESGAALAARFPAGSWDARGRTFLVAPSAPPAAADASASAADESANAADEIALVSAGTSDAAVVAEALATLRFLGRDALVVEDAGVAGLHRLLAAREAVAGARVRIVVAGMEGALPSVVAGLFGGPVIAVPTSVGYGAHLGGVTPLLAMLSSCAPGVAVVGIDNGFGAAVMADRILVAASARIDNRAAETPR